MIHKQVCSLMRVEPRSEAWPGEGALPDVDDNKSDNMSEFHEENLGGACKIPALQAWQPKSFSNCFRSKRRVRVAYISFYKYHFLPLQNARDF